MVVHWSWCSPNKMPYKLFVNLQVWDKLPCIFVNHRGGYGREHGGKKHCGVHKAWDSSKMSRGEHSNLDCILECSLVMAKKEPSFLTQKLWWRIDGSMNWGELLRKQRVDSWMQKHNLNTFERLTETWMIWSPLVDRCVLITKSAPKKYMIKSFVFCTRPSHLYTVVAPNVMLVGVYIYICIVS